MPALSRLRLGSIGCEAARFDPLDLELIGPDLRLRHTLLALRNGGGKSSLIGLVLLLLNPKVSTSLGRTAKGDKKLETDYVRPRETGIVLAEWLPDRPSGGAPRRHVTFMAMQRGEREGAADKAFVGATLPLDVDPAIAFRLEQLTPLSERTPERRALGVDALLRHAREVQRAHGDWDVVTVPGHEPGRWLDHLRAIGFDPGLATLLARMNLEEGDLAKALTFASADEFVATTSRLLAPPDDVLKELQRGILSWSAEHRDQAEKRRAREELARVRPRWVSLVERGQVRVAARERLKEEAFEACALLAGVEEAQEAVLARALAAEQACVSAEAERAAAAVARERFEGEAAAIELALASAHLQRAAAERERAHERAAEARAAETLARSVVPALRLIEVETRIEALQAQRAARRVETAPQARRRDALALGLTALARADARAAEAARDAAKREALAAEADAKAGQKALDRHTREAARLEAQIRALDEALDAAGAAVKKLGERGDLVQGEALGPGLARAQGALVAADRALVEREAALGTARETARAAAREVETHAARLAELGVRRGELDAELETARTACADLAARIAALRVPDLASVALPANGERALETLARAAREATLRHAEAAARLAALEATCESLRARDVLPPPIDVRRVTEAARLTPALDYLRATLGDTAAEALRAVPGLAHAAIAPSAAALDRAREPLERLELDVDAPVPVFLAADLTPDALKRAARSTVEPRSVVGLTPHASADARATLLARRAIEREQVRQHAAELRARTSALQDLVQAASATLARYGAEPQAALCERAGALDDALRATAAAQAQAQTAAASAGAAVSTLEGAVRADRSVRDDAGQRVRRLELAHEKHGETLAGGHARRASLASEQAAVETELTRARDARDDASARGAAARERERTAEQARLEADARAERLLGYAEDRTVPPADGLDPREAQAELDALHRALVAGEQAVEVALLDLKQEAEKRRKALRHATRNDEALHRRARSEVTRDLTEAQALEREAQATAHAQRAANDETAADVRLETADAEVRNAKRVYDNLRGAAREAARTWSAQGHGTDALEALAVRVPEHRRVLDLEVERASERLSSARTAREAARALATTWAKIVEDAREAWDTVRACAPELEPTARALVRNGESARAVLDPAGQAAKLGDEAVRRRREVLARRSALQDAERRWLGAAHEAIAEAERSTSEAVRRFATIRLPAGADTQTDPDARAEQRKRAVAERATQDLQQLDRELEDLDAQLADVAKNRATLAQQTGEQVRQLASRLRDLQRASRLPEGLGAWSGEEFLRVDLSVLADDAQLQAALEARLVVWADAETVPSPRDLLPDALSASLSGPPHVALPKADRFDRRPRRRPISQLAKDSGGEALTAAFILFCVIARVVSGGGRRERRVTLALIDNPLGTANRFDFVEAQCAVAAAFGVQYVAATGIADPAAVERFERLITLTNPGQERVNVERREDLGVGRPIEAALFAREAVLTPAAGAPRAWPGGEPT